MTNRQAQSNNAEHLRPHQWKKGQSGNPRGRPKGAKGFRTIIQDEAYSTITITENGRRHKVTKVEALFKRMLAKGLNGDAKAAAIALRLLETYLPHGMDNADDATHLTEEEFEVLQSHADFLALVEEARDARSDP